jgi:hypothetical protein
LDATAPGRLTTLIPVFKNKAGDAIRNAPKPLARQALHTIAGLAAEDALFFMQGIDVRDHSEQIVDL